MVKKSILLVLVLACMITIFSFSSQEATESKKTSSRLITTVVKAFDVNDTLSESEIKVISEDLTFIVRKSAHFSIYALLGSLIYLLLLEYNLKRTISFSLMVALLYACSDELHQTFVPGRSGELRDIAIDTAGAFCGIVFIILVLRVLVKIKNRKGDI